MKKNFKTGTKVPVFLYLLFMNIRYRFLQENNLEHLYQLFNLYNEVFQTAHELPKEEYLSNLLKNKNVLFLAACLKIR